MKTESPLELLAVFTSQELYLHVFCVCTHLYMCSEGRAEVQNCRTAFQVCFILYLYEKVTGLMLYPATGMEKISA